MSVKTIFQRSQSLRQNLKLSALAMAEYYENKERILKSVFSDENIGDNYLTISLESPNALNGSNALASVNVQDFTEAINKGDETVYTIIHRSGSDRVVQYVDLDEFLNSYAVSLESSAAYGCFFRTISDSIDTGKIEVSNFITSCTSKISNMNSGVIDHLATILKSSKDPVTAMQVVADTNLAPDTSSLVFRPESYGSQNIFMSTVAVLALDFIYAYEQAQSAVGKAVNAVDKIIKTIGATIAGLIQKFSPNILEDFELNAIPIGIMDVPLASFFIPESAKQQFLNANGDVSQYFHTKKFSGLRYHSGSQYFANFASSHGGWDMFYYEGLSKLFQDLDKTGIIEIPVSWGLIRCFKYDGYYYFYLYLQFEGQTHQESEYNSICVIPNSDNQSVCRKIYEAMNGLLESMSQFPILSVVPIWPSSDDYNDFLFWYNGDPSGLQDPTYKYRLFLDPTKFNDSSRDSCSSANLTESLNFINLDASNLNMDGSSKEQIILSYMLFEICYCYDSRHYVHGDEFNIYNIYNSNLDLTDIASMFTKDQFVPYYTYTSAPTYVHPQSDTERAREFKSVYIAVVLAIAAAAVSVTLFKVKKNLKMKALYKQGVASKLQYDLGGISPNDPNFKSKMQEYYKSVKSANLWSKISGIAGQSVANTFSKTDVEGTLTQLMKFIAG